MTARYNLSPAVKICRRHLDSSDVAAQLKRLATCLYIIYRACLHLWPIHNFQHAVCATIDALSRQYCTRKTWRDLKYIAIVVIIMAVFERVWISSPDSIHLLMLFTVCYCGRVQAPRFHTVTYTEYYSNIIEYKL